MSARITIYQEDYRGMGYEIIMQGCLHDLTVGYYARVRVGNVYYITKWNRLFSGSQIDAVQLIEGLLVEQPAIREAA